MAYINSKDFNWQDAMIEIDKPIWLEETKQKILNGNKMYRDLYINSTYAFLAPDNYNTDDKGDIIIDDDTQLQQASKEFNKICKSIKDHFVWACQETNQLELIDKTIGWRVRDFISEAWYQSEQYNSNTQHRQFAMWRRVANIGMQILTDDMLCIEEHMSKFDKLN